MGTVVMARRRLAAVGTVLILGTAPAATGFVAGPAAAGAATVGRVAAPTNCATRDLGVFLGGRDTGRTAGSSYYRLRFKNYAKTSCTLTGFPGVSAVTRSGRRLGRPAARDHRYPPRRVTLRPDGSATTTLRLTDVANYPQASCRPTHSYGLRVFPPNQTTSVVLKFRLRVCAKRGPRYLAVQAVRG